MTSICRAHHITFENSKDSTKKKNLLELTQEFCKVAGYKLNIQNSH